MTADIDGVLDAVAEIRRDGREPAVAIVGPDAELGADSMSVSETSSSDTSTEQSFEEGAEDDPHTVEEFEEVLDEVDETLEASEESDDLTELDGIGPATAEDLNGAGFQSFADIRDADVEALAEVDGISEDKAADLKDQIGDVASDGAPVMTQISIVRTEDSIPGTDGVLFSEGYETFAVID